jgi:SnoaL-like domain
MTNEETQAKVIVDGYRQLQDGDLAGYITTLAPDTAWHLVRPLQEHVISGRDRIGAYLAEAASASPEDSDIQLDAMATSGKYVFAIHTEGAGTRREHRHLLLFEFENGAMARTWELTLGGPENQHGVSTNMIPTER